MTTQRIIYACDIGSIKQGNFAWARIASEGESTPVTCGGGDEAVKALIAHMVDDASNGHSIALGFEAPMFIPVPDDPMILTSARKGEGNRPFSAGAGPTVLLMGMQQAAWILRELNRKVTDMLRFTTDWRLWLKAEEPLLLGWEAFVSGPAHSDSHERDAATAVMAFRDAENDLESANAVTTESPFSLIGAAAIWAGWTDDSTVLELPCLVLKPSKQYPGEIRGL